MTAQDLLEAQSKRFDEDMRQDIIEIRRELPRLGYELRVVYKEGQGGLLFSACYELPKINPDQEQAVATIRVSRYLQSDNHSLLTQASQIIALAQERGQTISRFYIDAGFSGADSKRPAFQAMMRWATGRVDRNSCCAVYCYDLYRFYRGLQGLTTCYRMLYDNGVALVSVADRHTDLGSRDGKLLAYIRGIIGEYQLDDLARTVRDNKLSRALKGYSNASSAPFGYCRGNCFQCTDGNGKGYCPRYGSRMDLWRELSDDPNVFVPHPVDQHAFRLMNEWHTTRNFSDSDIVRRLNPPEDRAASARLLASPHENVKEVEGGFVVVLQSGVYAFKHLDGNVQFFRPKGQPGRATTDDRRFSKDTVRDILQNPYYAGFVVYRRQRITNRRREQTHKRFKEPLTEILRRQCGNASVDGDIGMLIPGKHIPLISLDLYEKSQQIRGLKGFNPGHAGLQRRIYPLSGIIKCTRCQRPFRGNAANGSVRYYEDAGRATGATQCPVRAFRAEDVEEIVFAYVQQLRIPEEWDADVLLYLREGAEWDKLRRERRAITTQLSAAREMLGQRIISLGEYRERERGLQKGLDRLRRDEQAGDSRYIERLRDFPRLWAAATDEERKGLLRCIFHNIWIEDGVIVAYEPREPFAALLPEAPSVLSTDIPDQVEQCADDLAQLPAACDGPDAAQTAG